MEIIYKDNLIPPAEAIIELYDNAGLPRPTNDPARIKKMYENSDIIITAWMDDLLVGVSRTITDYCWCAYLADLAVQKNMQAKGIGRKLIELTKEKVGEQSMVLLLSVPTAMDYYPKVGFEKMESAFWMKRKM
jgi:N-acetylglutamate synthase-like GNAT family acetyltransferase